jgi:hypothetical protein
MPCRTVALAIAVAFACLVALVAPINARAGQTGDGEIIPADDCTVDPLDTDEAVDRLLAPIEIPEEGPAGLPLYVEDEDDLPTGDEVTLRTQQEVEELDEQYDATTNATQRLRRRAL